MKFNTDPAFLKKRAEAFKQKREDPNSGSSNRDYIFSKPVTLYKVRDGENRIRLLPNPDPDAMFSWMEIFIHYNIGANGSQYLCLAKMKNRPCPICEEHKIARDSGRPDKEVAALRPQQRACVYLIDRREEDPSKNPQIWPMPYKKVAAEILERSFKRNSGEVLFFDDPKNGYDIFFKKTGKELATEYKGIDKDDDPSPLHSDASIASKWLTHVEEDALYKILNFKSYDHIKAVLHGQSPVEEEKSEEVISTKTHKYPKETKTSEIPVGDGLSLAKLTKMSREELVSTIEDKQLDLDPDEWTDNEDLSQAIALQLGITS